MNFVFSICSCLYLYRCAVYNTVPADCSLATDPTDTCCQVPVCSPTPAPGVTLAPIPGAQTPSPGPYVIPSLRPVVIGQGVTPSPQPGASTSHPPVPVCVYYGKKYGQGEKWRDGCQYICECIDANSGQYKCQERYVTGTRKTCPYKVYPLKPTFMQKKLGFNYFSYFCSKT